MRTILCLFAGLSLAPFVSAQRLATYLTGPGFFEHQPPTAILPAPYPPILGYPAVPAMPVMPAPAGDSSFNNLTGLHWVTNGALLATQPTPTFPPAGPIFPPVPIPAAVLAAIGGAPVTGIAINPIAGILYLVGMPGIVVGCGAVPALPIVVPPFPIVGIPGPITGLEWDGATGSLYAVNAPGFTSNFLPGGALLGPPLAPPMPLVAAAGDVAIDKTMRLNAVGLRPLYVVAGPMLLDVRDPAPIVGPAAIPMATGLAFLDHPAAMPPAGACPCPPLAGPINGTNGPMAVGNLAWTIGVTGIAPGGIAVFAFDTVFNPAYPLFNVVGCGLGLIPGSPTLIAAIAIANPAGTATLPLPLGFPLGAGPLYNQNLTFCPADPTGFVFTPMQSIYVAGF
ncbi:MAG: hypothetical protein WAT39_19775 [Planctomycetota bacterium]